jgi:hypothetical protein
VRCQVCGGDPAGGDVCPACLQREVLEGRNRPGRTVVYLSGGITGCPDYKQAFQAARMELHKAGFTVLDPSTFAPAGAESWAWEQWMDYDLAILQKHAEAVFMLEDWMESAGAKKECALALKLGRRVYFQGSHEVEDMLKIDDETARVLAAAECI